VLALAVAVHAEAEADPALFYSAFGGHSLLPYHPITYTATAPFVYNTPLIYAAHTGCTNVAGAVVPCALGGFPVVAPIAPAAAEAPAEAVEAVDRKKREADAEPEADAEAEADPEADPWVFYSTHGYWPVGYSHYAPHTYTYAPYTYAAHYGHYGLGHLYGKREAEADAEADPEADPWLVYSGIYGGHHLPYGYGYHHALPYYLGGCRNYLGSVVPCAGR